MMKAWQIMARRWSSPRLQRLPLQFFGTVPANSGKHHRSTSVNAPKTLGTIIAAEHSRSTSSVNYDMLAGVTVVKTEDAAATALAKLLEVAASDPERMFACDTEVGHVYRSLVTMAAY